MESLIIFFVEKWLCLCLVSNMVRVTFFKHYLFLMNAIYLQLGIAQPSSWQGCFSLYQSFLLAEGRQVQPEEHWSVGSTSTDVTAFCPWTAGSVIKGIIWVVQDSPGVYGSLLWHVWNRLFLLCACQCPLTVLIFQFCLLIHPVFLNRCKCRILASVSSKGSSQGNISL